MEHLEQDDEPTTGAMVRWLCALLGVEIEVISRESAAIALLRRDVCSTCGRPL